MTMRPAFLSRTALVVFLASISFFLVLPVVMYHANYPAPDGVYKIVPTNFAPYDFFHRVIFEEKGDIDVLIIGPSYSWNALDAGIIKQALSEKLGREAVVYNFGSNWRGENVYYYLLRDLTRNRNVKLFLFNPPKSFSRNDPHPKSSYFMLYGHDEVVQEMSFFRRLQAYAFVMLGTPRHLVSLLRDNRTTPASKYETDYDRLHPYRLEIRDKIAQNVEPHFGTQKVYSSIDGPFIAQEMIPPEFTAEQLLYSKATEGNYTFSGRSQGRLLEYQSTYIKHIFRIARNRGVAIATFHVPIYKFRKEKTMGEVVNWATHYPEFNLAMLGIPSSELFKGLSEEQLRNMYYDNHMNVNGAAYYTKALLPGILALYDNATHQK
ncbi:MAG: hypothetical protein HQL77_09970 [Magnetococcales bacterium]|nr:hypothetical protein [Magnetococcales bacterium]